MSGLDAHRWLLFGCRTWPEVFCVWKKRDHGIDCFLFACLLFLPFASYKLSRFFESKDSV